LRFNSVAHSEYEGQRNHHWKPRAAHRRTGKVYLNLDCDAIDVRQFKAPLAAESIK